MSNVSLKDLDFNTSSQTQNLTRKVCWLCKNHFTGHVTDGHICEDCQEDFKQWKQECEGKRQIMKRMGIVDYNTKA